MITHSLRTKVRDFLAANVPLSMQAKPFEDACVAECLRMFNSHEVDSLDQIEARLDEMLKESKVCK